MCNMGRKNNREQIFVIRFGTHSDTLAAHTTTQKAHVMAVTHQQAERMAKHFPNAKSVCKAQEQFTHIVAHDFNSFSTKVIEESKRDSPMVMDEMIWARKKKAENKDKEKVDKVERI